MSLARCSVALRRFSGRAASARVLVALVAGLMGCQAEHLGPVRTGASSFISAAAGRPNIVVIMTDDQTVESMRIMPQTLGLIGSAGVTFVKNVVTYSLCCPSRATFLTGQYPHNHGVLNNGPPDGGYAKLDHSNTLPVWLQAAGYVTGNIGKYLNGYGLVDSLEIPPGWTEWYAGIGAATHWYYNYVANENGVVVRYGAIPEHYQSDLHTGKAVDFILRHAPAAATDSGPPFFLWVAYSAPHGGSPVEPGDPSLPNPFPAPRHKGRFAGEVLPASPAFNEPDMTDKPASMRSRASLGSSTVSAIGEAYRQRLESLLAVDEGVASIIGALQSGGVLENTLVIFTSDNGYFHGEHRVPSGKALPYEPAVRVPLLIRGPGVVSGGLVSAPVANVDLAPTIVEAAGATAGRTIDGRSLLPFLAGQTNWPFGHRHVMVEDSPRGGKATVFWSIRRGRWAYTEYANGDREFYDLQEDTAQVASLHASALRQHVRVRRELATRLAAMKSCVGPTACW